MTLHTGIALRSNQIDTGNLDQQSNRIFKKNVSRPEKCKEVVRLIQGAVRFTLIILWFCLLPAGAIADQCIEGDCVNGKGTIIYSTGAKYVGEFKNGKRDGQGILYMPLGRTFEGQFQQNEPIKGTYTYPGSEVYTGRWEFREREGRGTLKYADGRVYEGEFKNGLRHGKGVMTWPSGRRYEGDFAGGQRTGKGTLTYPDGRVYTGDFVNGELTGQGLMTLPDGRQLEGQFVNGEYAGP